MDCSKMSMDKLRELIAWADDRGSIPEGLRDDLRHGIRRGRNRSKGSTRRDQPPHTGDRIRKRRNTK